MKESVKVNISGQLFNLDIDAYEYLRKYLDSIERKFNHAPEEAKEILEDIEARIAELLTNKYNNPLNQVVTIDDIREIVAKLGTANEIDNEEDVQENNKETGTSNQQFNSRRRRVYRNTDQSILGGVCSGIAAYLNIDPLWIRILFIFLVFAKLFGLIVYIVLWAVIPAAKTTAQKLEMRGEDVNVENIKKTVSEEYEKIKNGVKNISHSKGYKNVESALSEFIRTLGNILLVIVKVIGTVVAVSLVIALILVILGFVFGSTLLFPDHLFHHWHWNWHRNIFDNWPHFTWFGICLFLVIVIPIVAIFGKLVRWLFNISGKNRFAAGVGATIWVVALISLIALSAKDNYGNYFRRTYTTEYSLRPNQSQHIYLDIGELDKTGNLEHYQVFGYDFIWNDKEDRFLRIPDIKVIHTSGEKVKVEIIRNFICFDSEVSESFISRIVDYDFKLSENKLTLDEYYSCPDYASWRLPRLKIKLYIPEGTHIIYSKETTKLMEKIEKSDIEKKEEGNGKIIEMEGKTDF